MNYPNSMNKQLDYIIFQYNLFYRNKIIFVNIVNTYYTLCKKPILIGPLSPIRIRCN